MLFVLLCVMFQVIRSEKDQGQIKPICDFSLFSALSPSICDGVRRKRSVEYNIIEDNMGRNENVEYLVEILDDERSKTYEKYVVVVEGQSKPVQKQPRHCIGTVTMMALCF